MTAAAPPKKRERWRPWLLAALTLAAIALFVAAGNWQRERMHAKEVERAALDAAAALPAVPLPRTDGWAEWRYRNVVVEGAWRGAAQILVDNRTLDGRAGFHVVTPLALDDARAVLVDRGWIAAGAGAARVPDVPAPSGRATVAGHIALPPARYLELEGGTTAGPVWQNLDPARIAAATGLPLIPVVIEQDAAGAPADGLVRRWAPPDVGIEMHRSYMLQWYAFAALAALLWIGFTLRRVVGGRRDG